MQDSDTRILLQSKQASCACPNTQYKPQTLDLESICSHSYQLLETLCMLILEYQIFARAVKKYFSGNYWRNNCQLKDISSIFQLSG